MFVFICDGYVFFVLSMVEAFRSVSGNQINILDDFDALTSLQSFLGL